MNDVRDIFLGKFNNNYVIKYPGLAGGKGVVIPNTISEGIQASIEMLSKDVEIIIEEKLYGEEVSVLGFCNGTDVMLMPQTQDYKTIYDNNTGPNTGGMGAICPANVLNENELEQVKIYVEKIVRELNYVGVLYAGLMLTKDGPKVLEFNVRFGDPEAQVILPMIKNDLLDLMLACCDKKLAEQSIEILPKSALTVTMASKGYPQTSSKGDIIEGLQNFDDKQLENGDTTIFHAATKCENDTWQTNGGRVLYVTAMADNLESAREKVYQDIEKIKFEGSQYRTDIAKK